MKSLKMPEEEFKKLPDDIKTWFRDSRKQEYGRIDAPNYSSNGRKLISEKESEVDDRNITLVDLRLKNMERYISKLPFFKQPDNVEKSTSSAQVIDSIITNALKEH